MTTGPAHWELLARARSVDNQVPLRQCPTFSHKSGGANVARMRWASFCHVTIRAANFRLSDPARIFAELN